jgi:hypothetical protein
MLTSLGMFGARAELPDIRTVPPDLVVPALQDLPAAPGRRVRETATGWPAPAVYHTLYLPEDWKSDGCLPMLVEFTGNGGFTNAYGDVCTGLPEDAVLGYGLSGGRGYLWLSLPYLRADGATFARTWWGDAPAHDPASTLRYAREAIAHACRAHGGDSNRVVFCGFSRGAIAGNALGLHDDETGRLWSAFFLFSHYDGVRAWPFPHSDPASARTRLQRLQGRPQFICGEGVAVEPVQQYLAALLPGATNLTFHATGFRNHSDAWTLRPSSARAAARAWLARVTQSAPSSFP